MPLTFRASTAFSRSSRRIFINGHAARAWLWRYLKVRIGRGRSGAVLAVVLSVVISACGGDTGSDLDAVPAIPGLASANEVQLVELQPDPSDDSYTWSHAYRVGELPPINVGQPTPESMAAAARDPASADAWVCLGSGGSVGCGELDGPGPEVIELTYGGADIRAWAWVDVPDGAVAVQFTDQNGNATWQRSATRLVIFPHTIDGEPDGGCPSCRFEAIDSDGVVIATVDIETGTLING
jgi:hypothetical protein